MRKLLVILATIATLGGVAHANGPAPSVGLYWFENFDPTSGSGVSAPLNQLLVRTDNGSIYYKSGTSNTAWTLIGKSTGGSSTVNVGPGLQGDGSGGSPVDIKAGTSPNQVPVWSGAQWANALLALGTNVSMSSTTCGAGTSVTAISGSGVGTCTANISSIVDGTSVTHSTTNGAATINVNLPAVNCAAGTQVSAVAADGTATCSTDVTQITAGTGITVNTVAGNATVTANLSAVAAGTGISVSTVGGTATVTANLAGGTCANGQVVTAVSATGVATCAYPSVAASLASQFYLQEEFCNAGTNGNLVSYSVSGGTNSNTNTVLGNPCVNDMTTGAGTTGRANWDTAVNQLQTGASSAGKWVWTGRVQVPTLSSSADEYVFYFGPASTYSTATPVATIQVLYDRGNVVTAPTTGAGNTGNKQDWIVRTSDASLSTEYVLDGSVVCDGGFTSVLEPVNAGSFVDLEIDYDATLGTPRIDFLFNGTKACQITTHIPTGTGTTHTTAVMGAEILKSAGTNSRDVLVDYSTALNTGLSR